MRRHDVPVFLTVSPLVVLAATFHFFSGGRMPAKTNPNFFYTDKYGREQGPITGQQLKTLAETGIITPNTPIETDIGHKGKAIQIVGLFKDTTSTPMPPLLDPSEAELLELAAAEQSAIYSTVPTNQATKASPKTIGSVLRRIWRIGSQISDTYFVKIIYFFICVALVLLGLWLTLQFTGILFGDTQIWREYISPRLAPFMVVEQQRQAELQKQREKERQQEEERQRLAELQKQPVPSQQNESRFKDIIKDIYMAVRYGTVDDVQYFLDKGANVNAKEFTGFTPLHLAARKRNNVEMAEFLITKGANVNAKDNGGWTPLHLAAQNDNVEMAEFLITKGANVNAKDNGGLTPLYLVNTENGNVEMAEFLISKGANVNAKSNGGLTLLHWMAALGCHTYDTEVKIKVKEILEFHISKGADVNAKDDIGRTPLHWAAENDKVRIAELLDSVGVVLDTDASTSFYETASVEMAEFLISKGANVNAKDNNGRTPLHGAATNNNVKLAELLVSKGADVNAKDKRGETPLDIARNVARRGIRKEVFNYFKSLK